MERSEHKLFGRTYPHTQPAIKESLWFSGCGVNSQTASPTTYVVSFRKSSAH